ncbi:MAG: hypothetical protein ABFE08_18070 [Armatimonadia bacterium]
MILLASRQANRLTMVIIVILALLLGALAFDPALNMGGDNAEYLGLARALSTGQGFTVLSAPVPHPETQRTPGYPLFLALFMRIFGEELWALKLTSLLLMAASALLAYRFLRCQRASTLLLSAFGVWLFIWNLDILALGSVTGSEMLYTFVTMIALLAAVRYVGKDETVRPDFVRNKPHTWAWLIVMVLAAVASIYVRPNGITMVPALGMYLLLRREWRALLVGLIAGGLLLTPLIQLQRQAAAQGPTYLTYMNTSEEGDSSREMRGAGDLVRRIARTASTQTLNLGQLLILRPEHFSLRPRPVIADPQPGPQSELSPAASAVPAGNSPLRAARHASRYLLGLIVILGFIITWRGRGSAMHWYTLMNILLLLLSPFPRGRYLLPLLPLWGWFFAMAVMWGTSLLLQRRTPGRALLVIIGLIAVGTTTVGIAQRVALNWENRGLSWHAPQRYALDGTDFVNYAATMEWTGLHTPENAVVVARKPYNVYWVTGRHSTWAPLWIEQPDRLWQSLVIQSRQTPLYVIQDGFRNRYHGDLTNRNLAPALAAHRQEIDPVFRVLQPQTTVWRLRTFAGALQP